MPWIQFNGTIFREYADEFQAELPYTADVYIRETPATPLRGQSRVNQEVDEVGDIWSDMLCQHCGAPVEFSRKEKDEIRRAIFADPAHVIGSM